MCKLKRLLLPVRIFIILFFIGKSSVAADFENWTFLGGETKIGNMDFSFHNANFFRHESDYFLNHTQLSLDFPSKSNFSFGIGYKQEYVEFPGKWRKEYRPMLLMYYSKTWGNFKFRDRSQWEFRLMNGEMVNRYRNQLLFIYNKYKKVSPYFSTEFFFFVNKFDYTRQRTLLGAFIPIKSINFNLFLGHQINEDFPTTWSNKIMMGTGLSYVF